MKLSIFLEILYIYTFGRNINFISDVTVFNVEIFALSSPQKLPNPEKDEIKAIFFSIRNEKAKLKEKDRTNSKHF